MLYGQTRTTVFFCNTCNAPEVLYRDDESPRFRRQTVKVEPRTAAIVKNSAIFFTWVEPEPKKPSIFHIFRVPFDYPAHSLQQTVLPKTNGTNGKPRPRRCAFCWSGESVTRHLADIGPRRVPKSGHVTITKIENLHIDTRRKIHWFQKNAILLDKNNEVITEKPFQKGGVTRRLWTLGRLELTLVVNIFFLVLFNSVFTFVVSKSSEVLIGKRFSYITAVRIASAFLHCWLKQTIIIIIRSSGDANPCRLERQSCSGWHHIMGQAWIIEGLRERTEYIAQLWNWENHW